MSGNQVKSVFWAPNPGAGWVYIYLSVYIYQPAEKPGETSWKQDLSDLSYESKMFRLQM